MVVKKEVAYENLKPLASHCVRIATTIIDSELRVFILGEKKRICIGDAFDEKNKQNNTLRIEVVRTLLELYTDAGWNVEQAPDNENGDVVLNFI